MNIAKTKKQKKKQHENMRNTTLDKIHESKMIEFTENKVEVIPKLKSEKETIVEKLKTHKLGFEEQLNLIDKANDITKKIKKLKRNESDYFKNNSKYIFLYFEDKLQISSSSQSDRTTAKTNNLINDFFNIANKKDTEESNVTTPDKKKHSNNNYIEKYYNNVFDTIYDMEKYIHSSDVCDYCNKGEMVHIEEEGQLVCNACFSSIPYIFENEKPSYKEPPKEVCYYAYKRINHFKEIVAQFQGKETTQISDKIIDSIKLQIKKERLELHQITNDIIRDILKKINYPNKDKMNNKLYEHATYIRTKLGMKPPILTPEFEETLYKLFGDIQTPYVEVCPNIRTNFLHYHYTFYKLCEKQGKTEYLPQIHMLKDRDKIIEQDSIWKLICKKLNWKYISTV